MQGRIIRSKRRVESRGQEGILNGESRPNGHLVSHWKGERLETVVTRMCQKGAASKTEKKRREISIFDYESAERLQE